MFSINKLFKFLDNCCLLTVMFFSYSTEIPTVSTTFADSLGLKSSYPSIPSLYNASPSLNNLMHFSDLNKTATTMAALDLSQPVINPAINTFSNPIESLLDPNLSHHSLTGLGLSGTTSTAFSGGSLFSNTLGSASGGILNTVGTGGIGGSLGLGDQFNIMSTSDDILSGRAVGALPSALNPIYSTNGNII